MRGSDFAELTAFMAVAEQRSFAKAAAQLGIAPSTLSQTIRSLEERLGVRLLNRTTRSVAPTEAGERLLVQLRPAFEGVDRALEAVNAFRDKPMGTLRLLMSRVIASAAIVPLIAAFIEAYPEITVDIVSDDSHIDIVSGRFDAGLRIGELIERDMIAVKLIDTMRMGCFAAPRYLEGRPIPQSPEEMHAHACIRHRRDWDGIIHPWHFEKDGQKVDIDVHGPLIVNDLTLVLGATLTGAGIGYLPRGMAANYIANGQLVAMMQDWWPTFSGVYIYYPSRRQIPAPLGAFISFARRAVPYSVGALQPAV
jgi:DNA-binding transcriptional LysR family regulator